MQKTSKSKLNILQLGVEFYPYAKTGGMAHVIADLSKNLVLKGQNVTVMMPFYGSMRKLLGDLEVVLKDCPIKLGKSYEETFTCQKFELEVNSKGVITFYLVNHYNFFGRYTKNYYSDKDIHKRFYFFTKAAVEIIRDQHLHFDVIHLHDWMVGLFPELYREYTRVHKIPKPKRAKLFFSIHNLAFQGSNEVNLKRFDRNESIKAGMAFPDFNNDKAWNRINFLRHGIYFSDISSTVSANYANEIKTKEFSEGMQAFLKERKIYGITNGIDYELNNPQSVKYVYYNYNSLNYKKMKALNKEKLFKSLGISQRYLRYPMVFTNHRLAYQKGFDLVIDAFETMMKLNIVLIILGDGDKSYIKKFKELKDKYKQRFRFVTPFSDSMEFKLFAAGDMILSPSVYEPCGISHMRAMRFGVVPIARKVGGLADTINNYDPEEESGTGFLFKAKTSEALVRTLQRAIEIYKTKTWGSMVRRVMTQSFSWEQRTDEYLSLYMSAIKGKNL